MKRALWLGQTLEVATWENTFGYLPLGKSSVSKFNEFEPQLKSTKSRFQLSAGLNLEKCNPILSGINHFVPRLKFFIFDL